MTDVLGWPLWSVATFALLLVVGGLTQAGNIYKAFSGAKRTEKVDASFDSFQRNYMFVWLLIMLADWLQGTHMYTLYMSYDQDVGTLFLTGFLASAVFGTFIGSFIDSFGRKNGVMLYCVLEIIINGLEHYNDFTWLMVGRVLGGVSTSLLFSAFESWMVAEHRKRGYPEVLLAETFGLMSAGNGLVAVVAGVMAQVAADILGDIGPFQLAIFLTVVALVIIALTWTENYGGEEHKEGITHNLRKGVKAIREDPKVFLLGSISSCFEGATFTFVFLWVPSLFALAPGGRVPTGLVFSCFMICISIGGSLFDTLNKWTRVEQFSGWVFLIASLATMVPAAVFKLRGDSSQPASFMFAFLPCLLGFLVLETCVGLFNPSAATMRSRYVPGALMSTIMNFFRVPLNMIVVVGTKMESSCASSTVFAFCSMCFLIASGLQFRLATLTKGGKKQS